MIKALHSFLWLLTVSCTSFAAHTQPIDSATAPHIEVALIAEQSALVPGSVAWVGVWLKPDPEWHTYWRNPGDSGEAPVVSMSASADLNFGPIQWPMPMAIPVAHLVNYGYEADNLLMMRVSVPESVNADEVSIDADLSWLVCKEDCIPGSAQLSINLPVSDESQLSEYAPLFAQTRDLLPQAQSLNGAFELNDESIVVEVTAPSLLDKEWYLFPFRSDVAQHAQKQISVWNQDILRVVVAKSFYMSDQPAELNWLLSNGETGYYLTTANNAQVPISEDPQKLSALAIVTYIAMAFVGGLILNLMPCVLPVLSIKALGLQNQTPKMSVKFAYLVGVLVAFNVFALLIMALQAGGENIGWGFQMQEPLVLIALSFLFTYIALVLFDALAVGSRFAGIGESLVSGEGWSSNFFTGVLAVVVASPCTAPFMAAAVGIAMVSEPLITLLIFNGLAIGFALPMTLLFISDKARKLLPKPGMWMETFKRFLAFPMLATVAWLAWVYAGQVGSQGQFVLLIALISFSLFLWLQGKAQQLITRLLLMFGAILSIALPIWANNFSTPNNASASTNSAISVPFSATALAALKADNKVVVVNMTADWCITCKVNEQVAFSTEDVRNRLAAEDVTYMVGDWTNKNQEILNYLNSYDRAGVPLYVVYAGNKHVQVLPQILTSNTVLTAINQATKELSND